MGVQSFTLRLGKWYQKQSQLLKNKFQQWKDNIPRLRTLSCFSNCSSKNWIYQSYVIMIEKNLKNKFQKKRFNWQLLHWRGVKHLVWMVSRWIFIKPFFFLLADPLLSMYMEAIHKKRITSRAGSRHGQGWAKPTRTSVLPTQSECR